MGGRRSWCGSRATIVLLLLVAACGAKSGGEGGRSLLIYTSVTQDTVDAVLEGFGARDPTAEVEVFRGPTGEFAARVAAEMRSGGLEADVLWLTDPLSIEQYARDGLLREWVPEGIDAIDSGYRTASFFGTRLLNLIMVAQPDLRPMPVDWHDLASVDGPVAIPDPAFAGSAFAALGFFALHPDYGLDFYRDLRQGGALQVQSPGDVVTGVAEGLYTAGITLDRLARDAVDDGSPLVSIWPSSGSISLYSPIAVVDSSASPVAEEFVEYVIGVEAQTAIASTGWEPVRADVEWQRGGVKRVVDWSRAFDRQDELIDEYRSIFGE